jgi:plasmid stabilization system protein ParE
MTAWVLADEAVNDLERLTDFLLERLPEAAAETGELILSALEILQAHPEIGRPTDEGFRELVISRGRTGYLALYEYDSKHDIALVLHIRHQREQGYGTN